MLSLLKVVFLHSWRWLLSLLLLGLLFALLFFNYLNPKAVLGEREGVFAYRISLVSRDDNAFINRLICAELARLPFISEVYLDTAEQAKERLQQNQILMALDLPQGFISAALSPQGKKELRIELNPAMPAESVRLAALLASLSRCLGSMQQANYAWQEVYIHLTGDEPGSWSLMNANVFNQIMQLGLRRAQVDQPDSNPFAGVFYYLVSLLLLFALIPPMIVLDWRRRLSSKALLERFELNGATTKLLFLQLLFALFLFLALASPLYFIIAYKFAQPWALAASLLSLGSLSLATAMFMAALALAPISEAAQSTSAWLFFLLFFILAGALLPSSLFPKPILFVARLLPFYHVFDYNLAVFSPLASPETARLPQSFASLLPLALTLPAAELWRRRR